MATGRIGTTPVLTTRWSKAPAAGTTSLSGLDDNSVSLVYSVGYEAVYQNGVLLSRGNDYTATNGTTITLTTATVAGDIIEVFANQTIPLTDTYSQTVSDGRFIKNTLTTTTGDIIYASAANTPARLGIGSTGQVLGVSGGIPAWTAGSGMVLITTGSFSGNNGTSINDCFSSTYENYIILAETNATVSGASDFNYRFRVSGADNTTSNYNLTVLDVAASPTSGVVTGQTAGRVGNLGSTGNECRFVMHVFNPNSAKQKAIFTTYNRLGLSTSLNGGMTWNGFSATTSFTGITLYASGAGTTFTGTYYIYGLAK